jgi:hypothetical protein
LGANVHSIKLIQQTAKTVGKIVVDDIVEE